MVQRMQIFDDFDSSPDAQTVRYGYGDHTYEIDLSAEHQAEFDKVMSRYIEHSRRVDEVQPQPRQRRARRTEGGEHRGPEELRAIRQWARDHGYKVSDRGRIKAEILQAYDQAQSR